MLRAGWGELRLRHRRGMSEGGPHRGPLAGCWSSGGSWGGSEGGAHDWREGGWVTGMGAKLRRRCRLCEVGGGDGHRAAAILTGAIRSLGRDHGCRSNRGQHQRGCERGQLVDPQHFSRQGVEVLRRRRGVHAFYETVDAKPGDSHSQDHAQHPETLAIDAIAAQPSTSTLLAPRSDPAQGPVSVRATNVRRR